MQNRWFGALLLGACFAAGCGGCGDKAGVETPSAEVPEVDATPEVPVDPVLAELATLASRSGVLPAAGGADQAPREVFRRDALVLGNQAIADARTDVVVGVGEALWSAGERKSATAFLQRANGKLSAGSAEGKQHVYGLAAMKVEQGSALEAASLMERTIDAPPTSPLDFVTLSWAYLRAGRLGPAAAATRRGLRAHAGDQDLAVQAAEVILVQDGAEQALAALAAITPAPSSARFYRVRAESHLVAGDAASATSDANALAAAFPKSPWGDLLLAAVGGPGKADALGRARTAAAQSLTLSDARAALDWAGSEAEPRQPWPRFVPTSDPEDSPSGEPTATP